MVWQSLLVVYARTHTGPVFKAGFHAMLKKLYDKSFTSDRVKARFRGTWIFLFPKNALPLEDMANRHEPREFSKGHNPSVLGLPTFSLSTVTTSNAAATSSSAVPSLDDTRAVTINTE